MEDATKASGVQTASVFRAGVEIQLRGRFSASEKMVPVLCLGVQLPGHELVIQWTDESSSQSHLPHKGQEVQFYTVIGGVLHISKGEITSLSDGRLPRIRSKVEQFCLAVPLRKHPRYRIQGQIQLGVSGNAGAYDQKQPHQMNISKGGFGATFPDRGWQSGQEINFQLVLWIDIDGQPIEAFPQLELHGRAVIRNMRPGSVAGTVCLGAQFQEISESQLATLDLWLSAHSTYLREA